MVGQSLRAQQLIACVASTDAVTLEVGKVGIVKHEVWPEAVGDNVNDVLGLGRGGIPVRLQRIDRTLIASIVLIVFLRMTSTDGDQEKCEGKYKAIDISSS